MHLLNKTKEQLSSRLSNFIKRNNLCVDDEFRERLIHLLQGCADGKYKWQNLEKNCLLPIITRKLDGDLQEFYINHLNFGMGMTLRKLVNIHGEPEGNRRWKIYCDAQSKTNTFEYKNKKYGMSQEQFDAYNKTRSVTLENCISRHGIVEGTKVFDDYCEKQSYVGCKLGYFIEKYGVEDGTQKYHDLNKTKSISIENMIRVHGEISGPEKYHDWREAVVSNGCKFTSPISQELFKEIDSRLEFDGRSMFSDKNREFGFYDKTDFKAYLYDYVILDLKLCIEFNGDIYHANPEKYTPSHVFGYPYYGLSAKDIWDRDNKKNDKIRGRGYDVIVVWEADYRNNKEETILKCVEYINELRDRQVQREIARDTRDRCL
jgi:very-short-patch-repair endonuclease